MKMVAIKDFPIPTGHPDFIEAPSYDLVVEMTQEEYNHLCYLKEVDIRKNMAILKKPEEVRGIDK